MGTSAAGFSGRLCRQRVCVGTFRGFIRSQHLLVLWSLVGRPVLLKQRQFPLPFPKVSGDNWDDVGWGWGGVLGASGGWGPDAADRPSQPRAPPEQRNMQPDSHY